MGINYKNLLFSLCLTLASLVGGTVSAAETADDIFWNSVNKNNSIEEYEAYLQVFPKGKFQNDAKQKIKSIKANNAQEQEKSNQEKIKQQMEQKNNEAQMQAELAEWERLQQATDIAGVEEFIKRFPGGKYFTQALDKYSELKKKKSERALETDKKRAGKTFKDCRECPEMVIIPRGSFLMGSPILEPSRDDDEGPQHKVTIDYDLAIGKYEITFDEWGACTNEKQRSCEWYDPSDEGWGKGRQPVINVGWDHAQSYVNWLANKTGKPYRLLSESEWEYAARAGTITPFSTGDCTTVEKANYTPPILTEIIKLAMGSESTKQKISCPEKIGSGKGRPVSVGSYAPNAFGLYDMMGNVREWVQDCREKDYANAPTDGSPRIFSWCQTRVRRGGAWDDNMENLRSAARSYMVTTVSSSISRSVGFRVALPIGGGR